MGIKPTSLDSVLRTLPKRLTTLCEDPCCLLTHLTYKFKKSPFLFFTHVTVRKSQFYLCLSKDLRWLIIETHIRQGSGPKLFEKFINVQRKKRGHFAETNGEVTETKIHLALSFLVANSQE